MKIKYFLIVVFILSCYCQSTAQIFSGGDGDGYSSYKSANLILPTWTGASTLKDLTSTTYGTLNSSSKQITNIPIGTKVSTLKAGLTFSQYATIEILSTSGGSAVANQSTTDVTNTMVIQVTAEDGSKQEYALVLVISFSKDVTATTLGTLNQAGKQVYDIPQGTKVSVFKAGLTISQYATVEILTNTGGTAVSNQSTTDVTNVMVIQVTAEDGSKQEYTLLQVCSQPQILIKFAAIENFDLLFLDNSTHIYESYQWYKDGTPVSGETKQHLAVRNTGSYTVKALYKDGCNTMSEPYIITNNKSLSVYPNPASESITLALSNREGGLVVTRIFNNFGVLMSITETNKTAETLEYTLPTTHLKAGVYSVQVISGEDVFNKRLVIK